MSKSKRTQRHYHKANCNQKKNWTASGFLHARLFVFGSLKSGTEHAVFDSELVTIRQESVEMNIPPAIREESADPTCNPSR
jgi:hypothetical protein